MALSKKQEEEAWEHYGQSIKDLENIYSLDDGLSDVEKQKLINTQALEMRLAIYRAKNKRWWHFPRY